MIEELAEWIMHAEYNQRELRVKLRELVANNNEALLAKLPAKRYPIKCGAGALCDGDMCCEGVPYQNRVFNKCLDQVTAIIKGAKR